MSDATPRRTLRHLDPETWTATYAAIMAAEYRLAYHATDAPTMEERHRAALDVEGSRAVHACDVADMAVRVLRPIDDAQFAERARGVTARMREREAKPRSDVAAPKPGAWRSGRYPRKSGEPHRPDCPYTRDALNRCPCDDPPREPSPRPVAEVEAQAASYEAGLHDGAAQAQRATTAEAPKPGPSRALVEALYHLRVKLETHSQWVAFRAVERLVHEDGTVQLHHEGSEASVTLSLTAYNALRREERERGRTEAERERAQGPAQGRRPLTEEEALAWCHMWWDTAIPAGGDITEALPRLILAVDRGDIPPAVRPGAWDPDGGRPTAPDVLAAAAPADIEVDPTSVACARGTWRDPLLPMLLYGGNALVDAERAYLRAAGWLETAGRWSDPQIEVDACDLRTAVDLQRARDALNA
jgi:hypothetical protein